jgi:tetratricopeptide (TPR) repeat protein
MSSPGDRRRAKTNEVSPPSGWRRRGRGQWVTGSVVYGSVTQISDVQGSVTVTTTEPERPLYRVDTFGLDRPVLSVEQARQRPSRLLEVRYELVDFTGREPQLKRMAAWRSETDRVSVLLVHGPGGQGKSRLGLHFARECSVGGWQVMSGYHATDPTSAAVRPIGRERSQLTANRAGAAAAGILMVVEYAERWPLPDLLELVADAVLQGGQRVRVLLLARPAGTWWQTLAYRIGRLDVNADSLPLLPLGTQVDPQTLFDSSCRQFAKALQVVGTGGFDAPTGLGRGADSGLVLGVHMAAVAAVDARCSGLSPPKDQSDVSSYLLKRERDHWQSLHDRRQIRIDPDAMSQTVYTATLTGPLSYQQGMSAVERAGIGISEHPDRILRDHALAYPPPPDQQSVNGAILQPLYPDRLGEDFLALATPGHASPFEPDPWVTGGAARLLATDKGEIPSWIGHAVTVLIEASRRWPHLAHQQLYPLLRQEPQLAVTAGSSAISALAEHPHIDLMVLEAIESVLPSHQQAELDVGSAAIAQRLIDDRLSRAPDDATRASLNEQLAFRLSCAGLHREALAAAEKALQIRRQLAACDNWRWAFFLVGSLNNISHDYGELGLFAQALHAADEAILVFRDAKYPNTLEYQKLLATALDSRGISLAHLGRGNEALASFRESLSIRRWLVKEDPTGEKLVFARSVGNLGQLMADYGQSRDALPLLEESLAITRRESQHHPGVIDNEVARLLDSLAKAHWLLGWPDRAIAEAEEAADIYRRLMHANPLLYQRFLAGCLLNLSIWLWSSRQLEAALAVSDEAVEISSRLVSDSPINTAILAKALNNHSIWLSRLNRHEEAITAVDKSVQLNRGLAKASPVHEKELARSLDSFALVRVAANEDLESALKAIEEAIAIGRGLIATASPTFKADYLTFFETAASVLLARIIHGT